MNDHTRIAVRIVLGILLMTSFFLWSFWVTLFFALLGLMLIPNYWEYFIAIVSVELLYRGGSPSYPLVLAYLPVLAVVLYLFVEVSRTYIREQMLRS